MTLDGFHQNDLEARIRWHEAIKARLAWLRDVREAIR